MANRHAMLKKIRKMAYRQPIFCQYKIRYNRIAKLYSAMFKGELHGVQRTVETQTI